MKHYKFEKQVFINAPAEKLFQFHLDTNNLPLITPPTEKVTIAKISHIPLQEGSEVLLRVVKNGFSMNWHILIKEVITNKLIVDYQEKGIFKYWEHYHIFEEKDNGTLMTDRVIYSPPFGILGKLAIPFIKAQLNKMFLFRHSATKKQLE